MHELISAIKPKNIIPLSPLLHPRKFFKAASEQPVDFLFSKVIKIHYMWEHCHDTCTHRKCHEFQSNALPVTATEAPRLSVMNCFLHASVMSLHHHNRIHTSVILECEQQQRLFSAVETICGTHCTGINYCTVHQRNADGVDGVKGGQPFGDASTKTNNCYDVYVCVCVCAEQWLTYVDIHMGMKAWNKERKRK